MKMKNARVTKKCPFCAETIQAQAIKCRYCAEFLTAENPLSAAIKGTEPEEPDEEYEEDAEDEGLLFWARPSIFAINAALIKCAIVIALAVGLYVFTLEDHIDTLTADKVVLSSDQAAGFASYRERTAVAVIGLSVAILLFRLAALKSICYEVTNDRIEHSRGIFSRKIDNIDMFRVVDLSLHRSLFDCMVGVGTVTLITTDKTDPKFRFRKVRYAKDLYNVIKQASLSADDRRSVIHVE